MSNFKNYEKDGRLYKRVTTIQNLLSKPALIGWAVRLAVDYIAENGFQTDILDDARKEHKRVLEHSGDVGSQIHHLISDGTGNEIYSEEIQNGYKSYLKWARDFQAVPDSQEIVVYSDKHGYAGTVDWIGDLLVPKSSKKALYMVDFKTGSSLYPEQHVMQLTAYEQAYWETYKKHIPNLAVLRLCKDKVDYEWREYTKEEKKIGWEGFKALFQLSDSLDAWKELKKKNRRKK